MAYVKRRTTPSGALSTTLVESYRGTNGRPRQRILANLHGAETVLGALAKLAAWRERLRQEREAMAADMRSAQEFYTVVTSSTLQGRAYSIAERKEIDRLMRARKRLLKRAARIDADLARIQKDGPVIKKHCTATAAEVQAAIRKFKEELEQSDALATGVDFHRSMQKTERRRLTL